MNTEEIKFLQILTLSLFLTLFGSVVNAKDIQLPKKFSIQWDAGNLKSNVSKNIQNESPYLSQQLLELIQPEQLDPANADVLEVASKRLRKGGSDSGGGGNSVVTTDGQVLFIDLMTPQSIKSIAPDLLTRDQARSEIFAKSRFTKVLAQKDNLFFDCAKTTLSREASSLKGIQKLLDKQLDSVKVLQVEFEIPNAPLEIQQQMDLGLPIVASESTRLPGDRQMALAAYAFNRLWVSRPLYEKLSPTDQCGLSVHEALRHLNFSNILQDHLSQDEIEIATRFFMQQSLPTDLPLLAEIKLKLNKTVKSHHELMAEAHENLKRMEDLLRQQIELGSKPHDIRRSKIWENEMNAITNEINTLSARSSKLTARAISAGLSEPYMKEAIKNGLIIGSIIDSELTRPLPSGEYWDNLTLSKVRLSR